jgi:hypothetical protein
MSTSRRYYTFLLRLIQVVKRNSRVFYLDNVIINELMFKNLRIQIDVLFLNKHEGTEWKKI